jgi:hypothetical protein
MVHRDRSCSAKTTAAMSPPYQISEPAGGDPKYVGVWGETRRLRPITSCPLNWKPSHSLTRQLTDTYFFEIVFGETVFTDEVDRNFHLPKKFISIFIHLPTWLIGRIMRVNYFPPSGKNNSGPPHYYYYSFICLVC